MSKIFRINKNRLSLILLVLFAISVMLCSCSPTEDGAGQTEHAEDVSFENTSSFVANVGTYGAKKQSTAVSGVVAGGIVRIISVGADQGVLSAAVANISGEDIEYAVLRVKTGDEYSAFTFSGLKNGERAVLFEDSGKTYDSSLYYNDWQIDSVIYYDEELSVHEELFEISGSDGSVIIKNISSENVGEELCVYYKTVKDGVYYGGTTYRITADAPGPGQTVQVQAPHFDAESSRVLFVTYGDKAVQNG